MLDDVEPDQQVESFWALRQPGQQVFLIHGRDLPGERHLVWGDVHPVQVCIAQGL
jgi:hypothetical protein